MGIQAVKNTAQHGLYVWRQADGGIFNDGNGNVMNIPGRPFDIEKMNRITEAAKYYGAGDGKPEFVPGVNRVSEMRASEEIDRMIEGYIPSETDVGAWADAQRGYENARRRGEDYDQ
jgi:hypothetical protein